MANVSPRLIQMLTKKGFNDTFWAELATQRKVDPSVTHEAVYEALECEYMVEFGQRRYANYWSFRSNRDKKIEK